MIGSVEFAKFIVLRSREADEKAFIPLGETKLHKLIYICDGLILAAGINFIEEIAKAWNYGPVYPKVHNWLVKTQDAFSNPSPCKTGTIDALDEIKAPPLVDRVLLKFGKWTATELSAWSHQPGSPWELAIKRGWGAMNSPIKKEDMQVYFRSLLGGDF